MQDKLDRVKLLSFGGLVGFLMTIGLRYGMGLPDHVYSSGLVFSITLVIISSVFNESRTHDKELMDRFDEIEAKIEEMQDSGE